MKLIKNFDVFLAIWLKVNWAKWLDSRWNQVEMVARCGCVFAKISPFDRKQFSNLFLRTLNHKKHRFCRNIFLRNYLHAFRIVTKCIFILPSLRFYCKQKKIQKPWTHKSEKLQRYRALSWAQIEAPTLGLKNF